MKADRIFETILYARDLEAARSFYEGILGMDLLGVSELFLVFRLPSSVLLIFDPAKSEEAGRQVPSHGSRGEGHIAFTATDAEISQWEEHFKANGIGIEQIVAWEHGGRSLYVRDPAGNSVEFAPATLWGGDWEF
jgi:catechol 2,3-dioxygenase-like lactoylglutathione lyase family enzyme